MRTHFALIVLTLAAGMLMPGCGRDNAPLPPPPKDAKPLPWANEPSTPSAGGNASFKLRFEDINGELLAATEMYMSCTDGYGRCAYHTTVTTTKDGTALFQDVPVGNFVLDFKDSLGRRSEMRLDLGKFTGPNAGKDAGVANF